MRTVLFLKQFNPSIWKNLLLSPNSRTPILSPEFLRHRREILLRGVFFKKSLEIYRSFAKKSDSRIIFNGLISTLKAISFSLCAFYSLVRRLECKAISNRSYVKSPQAPITLTWREFLSVIWPYLYWLVLATLDY